MVRKLSAVLAVIALMGMQAACFACTDFQLKAQDGSVVIGRSNEFGVDANSQIVFEPAGKDFVSKSSEGGKGKSWTSRYAFLGINGLGLTESFADGMNEAGLSVEGLLYLESKYETVDPKDASGAVSSNDLVSWILGNFATVDALKKQLPDIRVWGETVAQLGRPLPLHFAVHVAAGNNLAVEFIAGEKKVYDNPVGVMTNMPDMPWQITHLRSYVNLDQFNPGAKNFRGVSISPIGQGSGWLGIPGDWSPPSRFVRIAYLVNASSPTKDAKEALNLAKHILNTVDIPLGSIEDKVKDKNGGESIAKEYTQWSVLKDLANAALYYYSYNDMNLKSIDLKKMASDRTMKVKLIPMSGGFSSADMTKEMKDLK